MEGLTVVKVFVGEDGRGGNPLGVFLDAARVPSSERQAIATNLNFSETVFVDNADTGALEIYTPATQIPFAGHPLVGTAWLLARERAPVDALRPPAGEVGVSYEGELTYISADPAWTVDFEYVQYPSPAEVDALAGGPEELGFAYCWAWIDEAAGTVRSRSFVPAEGIPEDEATGSAALTLSGRLGRSLELHQGSGSLIRTRYHGPARVEAGGRVERVE